MGLVDVTSDCSPESFQEQMQEGYIRYMRMTTRRIDARRAIVHQ